MFESFDQLKQSVYNPCNLHLTNLTLDVESEAYEACRFQLNKRYVISRAAKITPKKVGQFVTFWKRNHSEPIAPFHENDQIDFYTVSVRKGNEFGAFVFPKAVLIKKGIISTEKKEGKRAFRVYPPWDSCTSKQAEKTQQWQLAFFYKIDLNTDLEKVKSLFGFI